jgi:hypothetical protein
MVITPRGSEESAKYLNSVNGSVLEAHGDDAAALAVLHQQVEREVLDEVVAIVPGVKFRIIFSPRKICFPRNFVKLMNISMKTFCLQRKSTIGISGVILEKNLPNKNLTKSHYKFC